MLKQRVRPCFGVTRLVWSRCWSIWSKTPSNSQEEVQLWRSFRTIMKKAFFMAACLTLVKESRQKIYQSFSLALESYSALRRSTMKASDLASRSSRRSLSSTMGKSQSSLLAQGREALSASPCRWASLKWKPRKIASKSSQHPSMFLWQTSDFLRQIKKRLTLMTLGPAWDAFVIKLLIYFQNQTLEVLVHLLTTQETFTLTSIGSSNSETTSALLLTKNHVKSLCKGHQFKIHQKRKSSKLPLRSRKSKRLLIEVVHLSLKVTCGC